MTPCLCGYKAKENNREKEHHQIPNACGCRCCGNSRDRSCRLGTEFEFFDDDGAHEQQYGKTASATPPATTAEGFA